MVKGKGKRSSGANEPIPDGGVSVSQSQSTPNEPQIDESAFVGLRQKIEQRLKDQSSAKGKSKKNDKPKAPVEIAPVKKEKEVAPKAGKAQDSSAHGKKRDRNGEVIAREEKKEGKSKVTKSPKKGGNDETLRQEILAMGGTEEDLDLLADVDSESEVEGVNAKSGDNDLRKELAKMLEDAGHVVPQDLAEDEVEEEEEEDEEEEEAEEDAEDEEISDVEDSEPEDVSDISEVEEAPKPKEKQPEILIPKEYATLIASGNPQQMTALPRHLIDRIHEVANSLLQEENEKYAKAQQTSASSSHKFYTTIMASGTLSDKISALTLAAQESPLHNTKSLENLVALGRKRSRAQAVEVLRSLKDMFAQGTLLPSDRRLKVLLAAGLSETRSREAYRRATSCFGLSRTLLKEQFFEVIKILEIWCNDEIEFSRTRAVSYVYELLKEKPEQEANLLRLLVNKLGDPGKKIASRASYLLLQLEQTHPLMKSLIIKSVEEFLFRPAQKSKNVAAQLLDIYFSMFVTLLKPAQPTQPTYNKGKPNGKHGQKGSKNKAPPKAEKGEAQTDEMREKLTSGVLTGVNRAYPFTDSDSDRLSKHIDTLFRITHSSNFNTSIQALMLIQQLTASHQVGNDRFYRTLYESLLDPRVTTSSKQSLYLNVLFKALKNDLNVRRVKAFVKRIVQVLGLHQPAFVCGVFYLIRELEKTFTSLSSLFDQPQAIDDDDEEVFRDVPDEDDEQPAPTPVVETKPKMSANAYDPRKRDPEHSNADKTCLWELLPYTSHFHPSVSVNAVNLLEHNPMSGKPDMTIHTLTHFLDRFVYRTPKANAASRGASIMQPLAGGDTADRLVEAAKSAQQAMPFNSENFWKKKADQVSAEDVFFHEYFNRVNKDKARAKKGKTSDDRDSDDEVDPEGVSDNEDNEDEIWKALVDSRPELEDAGESDDDLDMDDLESAYDDDEDEVDVEGSDDEVIFNDESDVPSDEEMADFSGFEDEEEEKAVPASKKAKKAAKEEKKPKKKVEEEDEEDAFDMDVSDDEAFLDSDDDLPSDMELGGVDLEAAAAAEAPSASESKKRRKLKHLPTFASADDYAALLADEEDGM
ncbi:hypothetical protein N7454_003297 [Penicillium verhagenii]|nr:hypothetical protein N7454_003297 [Penicillium verhagenii]